MVAIRPERGLDRFGTWFRYVRNVVLIRPERGLDTFRTWSRYVRNVVAIRSERGCDRFGRKLSANIPLKKKKLVGRRHWTGNEVETSEALGVAGMCTNKGRLSFEGAMLL